MFLNLGPDAIHSECVGWIAEKLTAELSEDRDEHDPATLVQAGDALRPMFHLWFLVSMLALPLLRALLSCRSVVCCLRERGPHTQTLLIALTIRSGPCCVDACAEGMAMLAAQGASIESMLEAMMRASVPHVPSMLCAMQAAPIERLRAASLATALAQAQQLFRSAPYSSPHRLCCELMERMMEWQTAERAAVSASESAVAVDPASALSCSSSPAAAAAAAAIAPSSSSLPSCSWLSEFSSSLSSRLLAHDLSRSTHEAEDAELLAAIPQFDWIDLAEDGLMYQPMLGIQQLRREGPVLDAALNRVTQLTACEQRARAADDPVRPADGPLSTPAILAHLILQSLLLEYRRAPPCLLDALLSAAAVVFARAPLPPQRSLPDYCDKLLHLHGQRMIAVARQMLAIGLWRDDLGSFTVRLIQAGNTLGLRRWLKPSNAHLSMPLGWLAEKATCSDMQENGERKLPGKVLPPAHPHLDPHTRCDLWDGIDIRAANGRSAEARFHVQHAIDWHYATVTPRLREALSPHLIPDLHAEVLSWLMPPSTLKDPVAVASESESDSLRVLDSAIAALLPSHSDIVSELRRVQSNLRQAAVERGFTERAFEAERQMLLGAPQ